MSKERKKLKLIAIYLILLITLEWICFCKFVSETNVFREKFYLGSLIFLAMFTVIYTLIFFFEKMEEKKAVKS